MRLLLDANLSYRLVKPLQELFPGTTHVLNQQLNAAEDLAIWQFARQNNFTIVTQDNDFFELASLKGHPPKVIWLRLGNTANLNVLHQIQAHFTDIQQFIEQAEEACLEIIK